MPMGDGPFRMRCLPNKECRFIEVVMCRKHRRRRNAAQMRQVEPGVWECTPDYECRGPGNMHRHQRLGGRPVERHGGDGGQAMWAPSATGGGVARPGMRRDRSGAAIMPLKQVWCVRHGKRLPSNQCATEEETCHVCVDKSACLSTPLDTPEDLHGQGCMEVLCRLHHTLRSVGFVVLSPDRLGYQCAEGHPCRWKTLRHVDQNQKLENSLTEKSGGVEGVVSSAAEAGAEGGGAFLSADMDRQESGMDVFFGVGLEQPMVQPMMMMSMMGGGGGEDANMDAGDGSSFYTHEAASMFM